jgi:hypothetical protein
MLEEGESWPSSSEVRTQDAEDPNFPIGSHVQVDPSNQSGSSMSSVSKYYAGK